MDQISKILFVISNSLLIPDILFLILLFIRSLILVGSFYNSFMQRRRITQLLQHPKGGRSCSLLS